MKAKIWKALQVVTLMAILSLLGGVTYTTLQYLRTSPRFEVKNVRVLGWSRVTETQVLAQADVPNKANVFSVDLAGIRERVEKLQWVRHAIVQRVLPDTITIRVIEREPVGLARLGGQIYQFDTDAAVLDFDPSTGVSRPILDGLQPRDHEGNLRRVDIYSRVVRDLHGEDELSEVHINELDEVSVVPSSGLPSINLGVGEFRARWLWYLELRSQIQELYPEAAQVDFRFRNQIIVRMRTDAGNEEAEERVVWDVEKKSL
jgi:cell division septal protein FtsQ